MTVRYALTLLMIGCASCGPSEDAFPQRYEEQFCELWEDCNRTVECPGVVLGSYGEECVFDRETARDCLDKGSWTCDASLGNGAEVVIPPAACEEVYRCPGF